MGRKKSRITDDMERCFVCGSPHVQIHHIFFGTANRKISDKYGYVVPLCWEHHQGRTGAHQDRSLNMYLKKLAREDFLANFGDLDAFIKVFGKTWL